MISVQSLIGKGYKEVWDFKGRYCVIKGSRASKKSKNTALILMLRLTKYPEANLLVIRKTYRSLKDSCFSEIKWACNRLGLEYEWSFKESPLEAYNRRTGQHIYFRGLDDPLKITSITAEKGYLCWAWWEEAYEITSEEDFNMVDESIRGETPGLWKQHIITFNPWNERHWLKHRFFDEIVGFDSQDNPIYKERESHISKDGNILAITTNYLCNEWLDEGDLKLFEEMKEKNPRRYRVAGLGEWGIVEGLIYDNFIERDFSLHEMRNFKTVCGLDFGYTNDPTAAFIGFLDKESKTIYVWDELYQTGLSNREIFRKLCDMGYGKERFTGDSAEPKSIDELKYLGLRIKAARKGRDSIRNGIQYIQNFKIVIHPRCVNFITEINNYSWAKDKFGKATNEPVDDFNHLMDAMRYALESSSAGSSWGFSYKKLL